MPSDLPVLALIAVAAAAVALSVFRRTEPTEDGDRRSQAHRPGFLAAASDIVDASIAMFMFRQWLGRPTTTRADRAERARVALATADEQGRRVGLAGSVAVAPTRLVVAGTAASHSVSDLPDRQAHPVAGGGAAGPVWRSPVSLSRGGVVAGVALVAVVVGAFALWPRPEGAVLSATGTPGPGPTADGLSSTPGPSESLTPAVTATPAAGSPEATPAPTTSTTTGATPTPTPTGVPTATRTPRPTARATNTPRPTLHPTPVPTPTASPTTPTATPGPMATAEPTPTPTPTAEPTPTPTAEPTPTPTPVPTPDPTPSPTP